MEYVAGRTLKAIVREQGALDPASAIDIVVQILRAARFAHKRGVIHRDLKPHNVILDEEGRASVTDFGIARAGASDMTLTGSIMGTAQYLSPEQAQGLAVTAASDLYSVGVILYELLTGVVPFEGETAVAIAFKQVSAEPQPPSALRQGIPASLDAVVLRALAKDPAERYADADELIAALEHERQALPALATAATPDGYVRQGAYAGAGAGWLLAAPATGQYELEEDPAIAQARRRRRRRALLWVLAAVVVAGAVAAVLLLGNSNKTVTVPKVTGQTEQAAGATLRAAGLDPLPSLHSSVSVPSGLVISQSPAAASEAKKGSHVNIVVSAGPASSSLTNVAGLTVAKAESKLHKAGLKTTTRSEPSKTVEAGLVIGTEPPAETEVQEGHLVTLLVSSGPAPVRDPGCCRADARSRGSDADQRRTRARHRQQTRRQQSGSRHRRRAVTRGRRDRALGQHRQSDRRAGAQGNRRSERRRSRPGGRVGGAAP